jgi:hypothetical protein
MDDREIEEKKKKELTEGLNRVKERLSNTDDPVNKETREQLEKEVKLAEQLLEALEKGMLRLRTPVSGVKHYGEGDGINWTDFRSGVWMIEEGLGVSIGRAEMLLRELCGTGEIRSVRIKYDIDPAERFNQNNPIPDSVTFVRPSEWRTTEVDFEGPDIEVSEDDLRSWLAQKGSVVATDPKDAAIERQLALQPRPPWKLIYPAVRTECGKTDKDRGWSDDRIKKRGLELLRRKTGHSG